MSIVSSWSFYWMILWYLNDIPSSFQPPLIDSLGFRPGSRLVTWIRSLGILAWQAKLTPYFTYWASLHWGGWFNTAKAINVLFWDFFWPPMSCSSGPSWSHLCGAVNKDNSRWACRDLLEAPPPLQSTPPKSLLVVQMIFLDCIVKDAAVSSHWPVQSSTVQQRLPIQAMFFHSLWKWLSNGLHNSNSVRVMDNLASRRSQDSVWCVSLESEIS